MAKNRNKRKIDTSVLLLLILFPVALILVFSKTSLGKNLFQGKLGTVSRVASGWQPDAKGVKEEFRAFTRGLGIAPAITLTIESMTENYRIILPSETPVNGTASFIIKPQRIRQFREDDIEDLVRRGLRCISPYGRPCEKPLYESWTIATNSPEHAWTLKLAGIHPAGRIVLDIGGDSKEIKVQLPRLLPIWSMPISLDSRRGAVALNGHAFYAPRGDSGKRSKGSLISPSFKDNLCGFRVLCVTSDCVWFEIVYSEPASKLVRMRWPSLLVHYTVLDSGQSFSVIRFEGGYEAREGERIIFDEGDSMLLDAGGVLARNAVFFRYRNASGQPVADLLCITPGR